MSVTSINKKEIDLIWSMMLAQSEGGRRVAKCDVLEQFLWQLLSGSITCPPARIGEESGLNIIGNNSELLGNYARSAGQMECMAEYKRRKPRRCPNLQGCSRLGPQSLF